MLYKIVNPSDLVTFHADSDAVAAMVAIVTGEGQYEARRVEDGRDVGGLALFVDEAEAERLIVEWLGSDVKTWMGEHAAELAAALDTVAVVRPADRDSYDRAVAVGTPEDGEAFRREWADILPATTVLSNVEQP